MSNKKSMICSCGPFKPMWMKMVDNIYKSDPNDNSSHTKLVCYCLRKPDKLDRVASYLAKYLSTNLHRNNQLNVNLTMDAINSLMNACHSQKLNLFVVTFLNMIQMLLESNVHDMQLLGSRSFVDFSHIAEETPNYHREYEYLISHFAKMAHDNTADELQRNKMRLSGIKGISGVIRKSTIDQLQVNVLDSRCLNMILPALLLNVKLPSEDSAALVVPPEEDPSREALSVFKDIISRASLTNIQPAIGSLFTYIDNQKMWDPPQFVLFIVDRFLESIINTQPAYCLMKQLIAHLGNDDNQFSPQEKTGVVKAINKTVIALSNQAVGPDIFHNFKCLLQILRQSIESTGGRPLVDSVIVSDFRKSAKRSVCGETALSECIVEPDKVFQEAIIKTIADFAKNLPDTQKIEIMKFILNFDSMCFESANRSKQLIRVLLKTMLQVATQYKTGSISNVFNADFLNLLLNGVAVDKDPGNRIFVQKILHTLIDRHGNTSKLGQIKILDHDTLAKTLKIQKPPARQDIVFMKKTGAIIIENLFLQIIDLSNKVDNLENIYTTVSLIALEMGADQVVVDLYKLIFSAQNYVSDISRNIPTTHQCAVHALLSAFITTLSLVCDLSVIHKHVVEVISQRKLKAKYYLPEMAFNRSNTSQSYPSQVTTDSTLFFSEKFVKKALTDNGYDITTFDIPFVSKPGEPSHLLAPKSPRKSSIFAYMAEGELKDLKDLSVSMASLSVSEGASTILDEDNDQDKKHVEDIYSFASIQKLINETPEARRARKHDEDLEMNKYFREAGFEKICKDQKEKYLPTKQQLMEVINSGMCDRKIGNDWVETRWSRDQLPNAWEIEYPPIFIA